MRGSFGRLFQCGTDCHGPAGSDERRAGGYEMDWDGGKR